jgi:predicted dehydrogenase
MNPTSMPDGLTRRNFVQFVAAGGAGAMLANAAAAQQTQPDAPSNNIHVAMIGVGRQGKILLDLALKIPGVRFQAVCDIWSYSRKIAAGLCTQARQDVKVYDDYKEMLANQKDLQAVIIATPDIWHAPITNDCLKAGLHVYCEKEMSNSLDAAKSMVATARQTGKLLQIGHQRRSNPYYRHAFNLLHNDNFCGNLTTVSGQWNQLKALRVLPAKLIEKYSIPEATLARWGYGSMAEFYEWRWFKQYAGGPMTDLGSHQVDVLNWFLKSTPSRVSAVGGSEHVIAEARENNVGFLPTTLDMTLATYEWDNTQWGKIRGTYQVNLTTSNGGFFETFMGDRGSMVTAEIVEKSSMSKEATAEGLPWEDDAEKFKEDGSEVMHFDPLKSRMANGKMDPETMKLQAAMEQPPHQPHLENFFDAVRSGGAVALNCPPEVAYETTVSVLKANEAAVTGKTIEFIPSEFKV